MTFIYIIVDLVLVPRSSSLLVAALVAASALACAPAPNASRPEPPIAAAWRSRCGTCHMRIEPGTHTHAQLDAAASRHRARTRLADSEWRQLVDFLASDAPVTAQR